jgi:hypothetical protein
LHLLGKLIRESVLVGAKGTGSAGWDLVGRRWREVMGWRAVVRWTVMGRSMVAVMTMVAARAVMATEEGMRVRRRVVSILWLHGSVRSRSEELLEEVGILDLDISLRAFHGIINCGHHDFGSILSSLDFQESVRMIFRIFALLAEVKVLADTAFVSNPKNWSDTTAIALNARVNLIWVHRLIKHVNSCILSSPRRRVLNLGGNLIRILIIGGVLIGLLIEFDVRETLHHFSGLLFDGLLDHRFHQVEIVIVILGANTV